MEITKRFDLNEDGATKLVESTIKKHDINVSIDEARKKMTGGGLLKSLATNERGSEKRMQDTFDFFRAAISNDGDMMERISRRMWKDAPNLVNEGKMTEAEFKTLAPWNETTNSAGGYNVPPEYAADLARNLGKYGYARKYFKHWGMKSNKLNIPGLLTKPSVSVYAENSAIAASKPVEDQTVLTAKKIASIFPITNEALDDSNIEVYAVMIDIFTEQFQIAEDQSAFQNLNTNWNGLLWYGAGTITSGVAANGALAISRTNVSTGGKTTYPQIGDAAGATDNWNDLLYMMQALPSALYGEGKFFMDQYVAIALFSMRDSQNRFIADIVNGLNYQMGLDGQPKIYFKGYEIVVIPSSIMLNANTTPYDASAHVSTPYTVFCSPNRAWVTMGMRGGFVMDTLREATLDVVSLAANDLQALRMKERVAFATARPDTIVVLRTDAS